jgi:cytochrome c-type biogenesis protein CcmE
MKAFNSGVAVRSNCVRHEGTFYMFAEGRDVIIEGRYENGTLHAQQIMTSCPSKYEPKPGEAAPGPQASN